MIGVNGGSPDHDKRACPICLALKDAATFAYLSLSRRDGSGISTGVCSDCADLIEHAPARLLTPGPAILLDLLEKQHDRRAT